MNRSHRVPSANSLVCTLSSVIVITAAIVATATAWWATHGLLPLCTPLHTPFACPPGPPTAPPSMAPTETQHKIQQGKVKPENPPLQDQILDPEQSKVLQAQHSVSNSPGVSSSKSEEKGDTKVNTASKATNDEMNQAVSENPDSNKTNARKPVDRSSCGSNTTSSGEGTEILEKDEKEKEDKDLIDDARRLMTDVVRRRRRSVVVVAAADGIFENMNTDAALYASVLLQPGPKIGQKLQKCHCLLVGFGSAATKAYKAK
ncbi:transcription factor [Vigna unguiculata]|uniref:Transcription factor n=1 Tax=Vigna unguiculata TaxID=3917 RepID=A0A4D6MJ97_VIGUN|nr:transcription factor [Vigna unguiculata]